MECDQIFRLTEKHPDAFAQSATLPEFADAIGGGIADVLRKYAAGWGGLYYRSLKAHPGRYFGAALHMPEAKRMAELFTAAAFLPHESGRNSAPAGFRHISAHGASGVAPARNMGGKRYVVAHADGTAHRGISGSRFHCTYAEPSAAAVAALDSYFGYQGGAESFEIMDRGDGLLVTARGRGGIGLLWLALLDAGESLIPLMPPAVAEALAADAATDAATYACITRGEDGRDYFDRAAAVAAHVEIRER